MIIRPVACLFRRARRCLLAGSCLAGFLASAHFVNAQFVLQSDYVNVYFNDGNGVTYDSKNGLSGVFSGGPLVGGAANGTALVTPLGPSAGGVSVGSSFAYDSAVSSPSSSAVARISYEAAHPFNGSNNVHQTSLSPLGTSVSLNNNGTAVAELRIDWTATYTISSATSLSFFNLVDFDGNLPTTSDFAAVASSDTYTINGGSPNTASIAAGGSYVTYPSVLDPSALFYDFGTGVPGHYHADPNGQGTPNYASLNPGDTVTLTGFIDVFVDPGTAQVTVIPVPPLGITKVDNEVIVSWPSTGMSYSLETNSNLRTSNWVKYNETIVDNSVTNSLLDGNLFYRLALP
jgi:hypothetical protein